MRTLPHNDPRLSDIDREICKAAFAIDHNYRVEHYTAKFQRLIAARENGSLSPEVCPQTDRSGPEVEP